MVLTGTGSVDLVSFAQLINNDVVKNKYRQWLDDVDVVNLIASPELLLPKGDEFIEKSFERFTTNSCKGFFIQDKETKKYVGTAKIDSINFYKKSAEDGILIGDKEFWGKGIAYDVYVILLNYVFDVLGLERVSSGCNENNIGMIRVLEKLGYTKEGVRRKADYISGEYSDHFVYGILRAEYVNCRR